MKITTTYFKGEFYVISIVFTKRLRLNVHIDFFNALNLGIRINGSAASIDLAFITLSLAYFKPPTHGGDFYGLPDIEEILRDKPKGN